MVLVILLRDDDREINYVIAADLLHCSPSEAIDKTLNHLLLGFSFDIFSISKVYHNLLISQ